MLYYLFFFNDTATTEIYTLSLHDALPIFRESAGAGFSGSRTGADRAGPLNRRARGFGSRSRWVARKAPSSVIFDSSVAPERSEEHTSELQSRPHLVCRLLLVKKNICSTNR